MVLDESSVIQHHTSKTLQALLDAFSRTPYRLCATATPAPNDWTELGTHAEFLGIRSRAEMLAEFFVRRRRHADMARQGPCAANLLALGGFVGCHAAQPR